MNTEVLWQVVPDGETPPPDAVFVFDGTNEKGYFLRPSCGNPGAMLETESMLAIHEKITEDIQGEIDSLKELLRRALAYFRQDQLATEDPAMPYAGDELREEWTNEAITAAQ